jgi:dTDP-4-dehydrorhamnose reductase
MATGTPKVWLAGGRGMLGNALAARLSRRKLACIVTDAELDITNADEVRAFAARERPTHILNAAAYTRVDDAETHESDAFRVNALGPDELGRAAAAVSATLLHFSTDYVFDGQGEHAYAEDAACAPASAYGRTKRAGEERALAHRSKSSPVYVLRTSWLFGENGNNFVRTIAGLLAERDELRVVADQQGRPTYTGDLADAALELVGLSDRDAAPYDGIYHFANAGATSWYHFATVIRERCLAFGFPVKAARVVPVTTREFPRPAPRPANSVLDTGRFEGAFGHAPRPWQEALDAYLDSLKHETGSR